MKVYALDFDLEAGTISNQRLLIDRRDSFGEPDGLVVEYGPIHLRFYNMLTTQHQRESVDCRFRFKPCHGIQPRRPTLEGYHLLGEKRCLHYLGWEESRYNLRGQWHGSKWQCEAGRGRRTYVSL